MPCCVVSAVQLSLVELLSVQFSIVDVAVIRSHCHVIDIKYTLVRILLYVSLHEVTYCFSLGRNVQLSTSSEDSKNSLGGEKFLLPLKFSIRQTRVLKRRSFPDRNHHRWWINTATLGYIVLCISHEVMWGIWSISPDILHLSSILSRAISFKPRPLHKPRESPR